MGWWRRKRDEGFVYEDKAALKGFGGYEPTEAGDTTPSYAQPSSAASERHAPAPKESKPAERARKAAGPRAGDPPAQRAWQRSGAGKFFGGVLGLMVLAGAASFFLGRGTSGSVASGGSALEVAVPSVVEGWQSVAGSDGAYAYDVPPSWSASPGTLHGWRSEPDLPGITLMTSAFLDEGHCAAEPDRARAGSGVTVVGRSGTARAAEEMASRLARHAYTTSGDRRPRLAVSEPERTVVSFGGRQRDATVRFVEATVSAGGESCLPDTALVGVLAVKSPDDPGGDGGGMPVLVVYADQGYAGAPTREELTRILKSLRGVPDADRSIVASSPKPPPPSSPTG